MFVLKFGGTGPVDSDFLGQRFHQRLAPDEPFRGPSMCSVNRHRTCRQPLVGPARMDLGLGEQVIPLMVFLVVVPNDKGLNEFPDGLKGSRTGPATSGS